MHPRNKLSMNKSSNNPAGNKLGPGINEANLVRAIESSGYPLQGFVADKLKAEFGVTQEWGFIDRDTKDHRTTDLFAFKHFPGKGNVQPSVALLIKCKVSGPDARHSPDRCQRSCIPAAA